MQELKGIVQQQLEAGQLASLRASKEAASTQETVQLLEMRLDDSRSELARTHESLRSETLLRQGAEAEVAAIKGECEFLRRRGLQ